MPRSRCMLVMPDGASRSVGFNGVLVGRQDDCDLVLADRTVSRRHALVRVTSEGVEIVPLGRAPVEVNGKAHDRPCALADGDVIEFPGLALRVALTPVTTIAAGLKLARARGGSFGLVRDPFVIGGGPDDDLVIAGWPPAVLVFRFDVGEPTVELGGGTAELEDEPLEPGFARPIEIGDRVTCRGEAFVLQSTHEHAVTTAVSSIERVPTAIQIEMLPRGGLLKLSLPSGEHTVFLSDRRFDLMMALLQPVGGYRHGDFIADDAVRATVWPRNPGVGRTEINVLISRCRRDLAEVGLEGARLIQRAPGGGGTRFVVARDATIVVKR